MKEIEIDASPNQLWVTAEARAENAKLRKQFEDEKQHLEALLRVQGDNVEVRNQAKEEVRPKARKQKLRYGFQQAPGALPLDSAAPKRENDSSD